jgi:PIN domain nuclease of toxin-antitoxin system
MNLLLDACMFLWLVLEPARLSAVTAQAISNPANRCFLSVVSEWEIAVQYALGRVKLVQPPDQYVPSRRIAHGIELLELSEPAALFVPNLPSIHRDPFDRMLVCVAIVHGMTIVTPDADIRKYPVATLW